MREWCVFRSLLAERYQEKPSDLERTLGIISVTLVLIAINSLGRFVSPLVAIGCLIFVSQFFGISFRSTVVSSGVNPNVAKNGG